MDDDLLLTAVLLIAAATLVTVVWRLTGHYIDRPAVDYDRTDGQALQRHAAGHCGDDGDTAAGAPHVGFRAPGCVARGGESPRHEALAALR